MKIFANGRLSVNDWVDLAEGSVEGEEDAERVIVSLDQWRDDRARLIASGADIGVRIGASDDVEFNSDDLQHVAVFWVTFPKFMDGRGYSKARQLRGRCGFSGDIRAEGDVLIDQIPLMQRCGFTSFAVTHAPTIAALKRGDIPGVRNVYQSLDAGSQWRRRFEVGSGELRAAE